MTTVPILGTGKMGGALARRLASFDVDLTLWNRTFEKVPGESRLNAMPVMGWAVPHRPHLSG